MELSPFFFFERETGLFAHLRVEVGSCTPLRWTIYDRAMNRV